MKISKRKEKDADIIDLKGEVDLHSSPQLRDEFNALITAGTKALVINLKDVSYIDSSGLATFIEALQKMNQQGGKLFLTHLNQTVRGVFEIARLDGVFNIVDTEEAALAKL